MVIRKFKTNDHKVEITVQTHCPPSAVLVNANRDTKRPGKGDRVVGMEVKNGDGSKHHVGIYIRWHNGKGRLITKDASTDVPAHTTKQVDETVPMPGHSDDDDSKSVGYGDVDAWRD